MRQYLYLFLRVVLLAMVCGPSLCQAEDAPAQPDALDEWVDQFYADSPSLPALKGPFMAQSYQAPPAASLKPARDVYGLLIPAVLSTSPDPAAVPAPLPVIAMEPEPEPEGLLPTAPALAEAVALLSVPKGKPDVAGESLAHGKELLRGAPGTSQRAAVYTARHSRADAVQYVAGVLRDLSSKTRAVFGVAVRLGRHSAMALQVSVQSAGSSRIALTYRWRDF